MVSARPVAELSAPAFLQLAGHPLRWRLLRELAWSDRIVNELTTAVGEAQNLVSYHLRKLRDGGLVVARRSSADGRDTYYTVDLDQIRAMLIATGAAMHPGLRLAPPPGGADPRGGGPIRILFLCTGNSARSQVAEALTRQRSGDTIATFSAGSHPKPLHPHAVAAMRTRGIDLLGHRSKHLSEFEDQRFDRVITLCDRVREVCPEFPGGPEAIHWSMPDPAADEGGYAAFEQMASDLERRIEFLVAGLTTRSVQTKEMTQ